MSEIVTSAVSALLSKHKVSFEQIKIPLSPDKKPIRALEEILEERGCSPGAVVRSILFRTDAQKYVLLAMAGSSKADWGTLRKYLDERRLTLADATEVAEHTGYVIGAVPPVALPESIRILADESLHQYDKLIIGSGVLGYAFGLAGPDLCRLLDLIEFGSFSKKSQ